MKLTKALIDAGFGLPSEQLYRRLVIATVGEASRMTPAGEKTGKTHWACGGKQPVLVVGTDTGTDAVVRKLKAQGKEIYLNLFQAPRLEPGVDAATRAKAYDPVWDAARGAIVAAIDNKEVKTLVIDKADQLWEWLRLARFGKLAQVMPQHYGPVNAEFRELVLRCYTREDLTSVWIHSNKKEYKESKSGKGDSWTGNYERAGFGEMNSLVDLNGAHYYYRREDPDTGVMDKGFGFRVLNSREEMVQLEGMELEGDMCNFQTLAEMAYPGTDGEWY
jgi:hypothetical protein